MASVSILPRRPADVPVDPGLTYPSPRNESGLGSSNRSWLSMSRWPISACSVGTPTPFRRDDPWWTEAPAISLGYPVSRDGQGGLSLHCLSIVAPSHRQTVRTPTPMYMLAPAHSCQMGLWPAPNSRPRPRFSANLMILAGGRQLRAWTFPDVHEWGVNRCVAHARRLGWRRFPSHIAPCSWFCGLVMCLAFVRRTRPRA